MGISRKDWALLVVAAAKGEALSPVQLQKSLFLLSENLDAAQLAAKPFYTFKPYDYGPFCSAIYSDAEKLASTGLISISMQSLRLYSATAAGLRHAQALRSEIDEVAVSYLDQVVNWVRTLQFDVLIKSIYKAYPQMRRNSIFRQ